MRVHVSEHNTPLWIVDEGPGEGTLEIEATEEELGDWFLAARPFWDMQHTISERVNPQ